MIQKMKCFRLLFLAGVIFFSLVACGKENPTIHIVEENVNKPEYLSFFSASNFEGTDLAKYWIDHFAGQYNERLYVNHDGAAYYAEEGLSYRELLEKRLKSSSPDDLYIINAEDVLDFEKKGLWMDLSDMEFVDQLSEAALYQSMYNGKVFSVPLCFTGYGFCWNVTMLKKYGLSVPENLEEFLNVCEKLKAEGILPYGGNKGYALTVPAMCTGLAELYGSLDRDQRITALNSGEVLISTYIRQGFEFLALLIEKGYLDPEQAMGMEPGKENIDFFLNGNCAFICVELSVMSEIDKKNFKTEFTGLPVLPNGCIMVYGTSSRLCVNPNSKHLDTALKFIEMVGTTEALDKSAILSNTMSSAKYSKAEVSQQKAFELLRQPGQIPIQDFALHFNTWENIRNVCREICGGISVEEACAKLDELQRTELEIYAGEQ